jgi:hypothetical protein
MSQVHYVYASKENLARILDYYSSERGHEIIIEGNLPKLDQLNIFRACYIAGGKDLAKRSVAVFGLERLVDAGIIDVDMGLFYSVSDLKCKDVRFF